MKSLITTIVLVIFLFNPFAQGQQRGQVLGVEPYPVLSVEEVQDFINSLSPLDLPDFVLNLLSNIDYAVQGFKVVYGTVDFDGNPTIASGLVVVPQNTCPKDVMVYCHSTAFFKDGVPSNLGGGVEEAELIFGLLYGGNGYLTVLPDYLGLGESPGFHLFVDERTQASATVDLMAATKQLAFANNIPLTYKAFISGYSQGGHAGMSAFKFLQEIDDVGFNVRRAGLGSGPYNLGGVQFDYIANDPFYPKPEFVLYVIASCQAAYGNVYNSITDVLKPKYVQDYIDNILGQTGDLSWVVSPYTKMLKPAFYNDLVNNPNNPVRQCLMASDVSNWDNQIPTTMYYCTADEQIDFQNAIVAEQQFENNLPPDLFWFRALIRSTNLGNKDHSDCVTPYTLISKAVFDLKQTKCYSGGRSSQLLADSRPISRPANYYYLDISTEAFSTPIERVELYRFDGSLAASFSDLTEQDGKIRIDVRKLEKEAYVVRITDTGGITVDDLIVLEPIKILKHKDYHPLSYQTDEEVFNLDLSLLPDPVKSLIIYNQEHQIVKEIDAKDAMDHFSFSGKELSGGTHLLEVQTQGNSFFLEFEGKTKMQGSGPLSVFPNPIKQSVTIRLSGTDQITNASLFDTRGRLVWKQEKVMTQELRPDFALPAGVYQLRIMTSAGKMLVKRLVIQ